MKVKIKSVVFLILALSWGSACADECLFFKLKETPTRMGIPSANKSLKIKVGNVEVDNFYCTSSKKSELQCSGDDDGGLLSFKDGQLKIFRLHLGNPDKEMFHFDAGKEGKMIKFERKNCEK